MDEILKMTDQKMWTIVVSFFLPWIIAVVVKQGWTAVVKGWISFGMCLAVALGDAFFSGALTGRGIVSSLLLVVVVCVTSYKGLWKPTGIAEAIEGKVNL